MANEEGNPLVDALPPNTDYITYLTILEYNLNRNNVMQLNELLQDVTLTTNLGWDLVQTLLPLMPESCECLKTIARLGNPREVLLKVAEALRVGLPEIEEIAVSEHNGHESAVDYLESPTTASSVLIYMLTVLHSRIKTKQPSRFLSSSLQAILAAASAGTLDTQGIEFALLFIQKAFSAIHDGNTNTYAINAPAPDPEDNRADVPAEDVEIQKRLLQSFLTHLLDACIDCNLFQVLDNDIPGFCWSIRLQEHFKPQRIVPGRKSMTQRFSSGGLTKPTSQFQIFQKFEQVRLSLGLSPTNLKDALLVESKPGAENDLHDEDEPPSSADDIPLSSAGCLVLFAAEMFQSIKPDSGQSPQQPVNDAIKIFPDHARICQNTLGSVDGIGSIGQEPYLFLDSALAPAVIAIETNHIGVPADDEDFNNYLQRITLIAVNCPSPAVRAVAHSVATAVLKSHPSHQVRFDFIKDTLEYCPYENLKAVAVGWLKDELVEAIVRSDRGENDQNSIFANPVGLESISPLVFPDVSQILTTPTIFERWTGFRLHLGFFLAGLNLYYLLFSSPNLRSALEIKSLHSNNDMGGSYLGPLRQSCDEFLESLSSGDLSRMEDEPGKQAGIVDIYLVQNKLEEIQDTITALSST